MIILPDKNATRGKFIMPLRKKDWMLPSAYIPKDQFGNDCIRTVYRIRARLNDGHVVWRAFFEDRDDLDEFLFAIANGSLRYDRSLWRLPVPNWSPDLGEHLSYEFATLTFLTTTGSNQTYTSPVDWNNSNNSVECLGGGGSGGSYRGTFHVTGGGAGGYSKILNFSFATPGTTSATYRIGSFGASVAATTVSTSLPGNVGTSTWFNNTTDPGNGADNSKCSAAGGGAGENGTGSRNGGAGGATTLGWGQTKYAGGRGGNLTGGSGSGSSGGGGAAGPSGAGGAGVDSSSTNSHIKTGGGSANNGTTAGGAINTAGNNGTEFDATHGSGSGGGSSASGGQVGGAGGNYGGGGGGAGNQGIPTSGAGSQGLIAISYTPPSAIGFNLAMLGM